MADALARLAIVIRDHRSHGIRVVGSLAVPVSDTREASVADRRGACHHSRAIGPGRRAPHVQRAESGPAAVSANVGTAAGSLCFGSRLVVLPFLATQVSGRSATFLGDPNGNVGLAAL